MNDRETTSMGTAFGQLAAEAAVVPAPEATHIGLWAYLAEVRVIARDGHRSELRIVRGLFCARNHHHQARARAAELANRQASKLGHVLDVSVTRLW